MMIERLQAPAHVPQQSRQGVGRQAQEPAFAHWIRDASAGEISAADPDAVTTGQFPAVLPTAFPTASSGASPSTIEYEPGLEIGPDGEVGQPGWPVGELLRSPTDAVRASAIPTLTPMPAGIGTEISVGEIASGRFAWTGADEIGAQPPVPITRGIDANGMPVAGTIELHLRVASGREEIIALPWRLAADGSLGQRIVDGSLQDQVAAMGAGADLAAGGRGTRSGPTVSGINPAVTITGSLSKGGENMPVAGISGVRDSAPVAKPHGNRDPATTQTAYQFTVDEWSMRWMRWIERDGRLNTAWVRDYRGGEEQASRLAGEILAFCREHKLPLQRLVINGHERWASADAHRAREAVCR